MSANPGELGAISTSGSGHEAVDIGMELQCIKLRIAFGVQTPVFLIRENDSPNAFFHPAVFHDLLRRTGNDDRVFTDGTIFFGTSLIGAELKAGRRHGLTAILAHEFAHAMQSKRKCQLTGKWRELHADFMAGWYISREGIDVDKELIQGWFAIDEKGDYGFGSPDHHGTPNERGTAFMAGYMVGSNRVGDNVANAGTAYRNGLDLMAFLKDPR